MGVIWGNFGRLFFWEREERRAGKRLIGGLWKGEIPGVLFCITLISTIRPHMQSSFSVF